MFKELLSRPDRSIEWLCSEQDQDDGEMVDNGREALHSFRMKESHLRMHVYLLSSGLSSFTEGLKISLFDMIDMSGSAILFDTGSVF